MDIPSATTKLGYIRNQSFSIIPAFDGIDPLLRNIKIIFGNHELKQWDEPLSNLGIGSEAFVDIAVYPEEFGPFMLQVVAERHEGLFPHFLDKIFEKLREFYDESALVRTLSSDSNDNSVHYVYVFKTPQNRYDCVVAPKNIVPHLYGIEQAFPGFIDACNSGNRFEYYPNSDTFETFPTTNNYPTLPPTLVIHTNSSQE